MSTYEKIIKILEERIKNIKDEDQYLEMQRELAITSKNLALEIGVCIQSVGNKIKRMLEEGTLKEVERVKNKHGDMRGSFKKKSYCFNEEYLRKQKWQK